MTDRLSDSDRRMHLVTARLLVGDVLEHDAQLVAVMRESHAGFPSGHEGDKQPEVCPTCMGNGSLMGDLGLAETCGDCEGSGYVTDDFQSRTESAALSPDEARKDLREHDKDVVQLRGLVERIHGRSEKWLTTYKGTHTKEAEPGCVSCKRIKVQIRGVWRPLWEPRQEIHPKGGKAQFDERCRWCADWFKSEGQNPPLEILKLRHQGVKITSAVLAKHGIKTKQSARERQGRKAS